MLAEHEVMVKKLSDFRERHKAKESESIAKVENDVRYANITIIEGHDASQYGIGIVSARIAEMVLRDERSAIPIGSYQREFGVTLSLPSHDDKASSQFVDHRVGNGIDWNYALGTSSAKRKPHHARFLVIRKSQI